MLSRVICSLWLSGTAFRWCLSAQRRVGQTCGRMQDAGWEPPRSKAVVCRLLMAVDIGCWRGRSSPAGGRSGAASMLGECLAHVSGWSPSGRSKMGLDTFPSSVATAGIGSAGSGDLLCSQGLGKASLAVTEAEKAKVTAARQGLFSPLASPCCENKTFTGPEEGSVCVWASKEECRCLWEDWLTLRPSEFYSNDCFM